jgi:hypothetical protein
MMMLRSRSELTLPLPRSSTLIWGRLTFTAVLEGKVVLVWLERVGTGSVWKWAVALSFWIAPGRRSESIPSVTRLIVTSCSVAELTVKAKRPLLSVYKDCGSAPPFIVAVPLERSICTRTT